MSDSTPTFVVKPVVKPQPSGRPGLAFASPGLRRTLPYALIQRLPWPYWGTALGVAALYYVGYMALLMSEGDGQANIEFMRQRALGFPICIGLLLFLACYLERAIETMLVAIRPVVLVTDEEYTRFTEESLHVGRRADGGFMLLGILLGPVAWPSSTAPNWRLQIGLMVGITLVAWLSSTWLGTVWRGVRAIIRLQVLPLTIDIFDSDDLRPLATLSLRLSAPIALVTLLMIVFWGFDLSPVASYLYAVFLLAGALSFFLPLHNLHTQMLAAKVRELEIIQTMVRVAYERLKTASEAEHRERAQTLANLLAAEARVMAAPTWPYDVTIVGQLAATLVIPLALTLLQILSSRW